MGGILALVENSFRQDKIVDKLGIVVHSLISLKL